MAKIIFNPLSGKLDYVCEQSGTSGYSGFSGVSGYGYSGTSGTSGYSGASGSSGTSGESGTSGFSGTSGASGTSGISGYSGVSGESGFSGTSGSSGLSGTSGTSGYSGASGQSGTSGTSGFSGISGTSGESGTSGFSGNSGFSGTSGTSGTSGSSGYSGESGTSGFSGTSGISGLSGASGTSGFSGKSGISGTSGFTGASGTSGISGYTGASGTSGTSGYTGSSGTSGTSGYTGASGTSGTSGFSGKSGTSGTSGYTGASGTSGTSGFSGKSGTSGFSGTSGTSGTSGYSGTSGTSGTSGYSGTSGTSGYSGTSGGSTDPSVYAKLDGTNMPFTGNLSVSGAVANVGTTITGKTLHVHSATTDNGIYISSAAPDICLGDHETFASATNHVYLGMATGNSHFLTNTVAGDGVLYTAQAKKLLLGANATEYMRIASDGKISINGVSTGPRLYVVGDEDNWTVGLLGSNTSGKSYGLALNAGTTSADTAFQVTNKAGTYVMLKCRGDGNVGLGTTTPGYTLELSSNSAGKPGTGGLWTVVSDERIKTDIEPADLNRCYDIVKNIPLKYFAWADGVYSVDQEKDRHNLGWIAQDVQSIFPKAVNTKTFYKNDGTQIDDCLDLNSGQIVAALYGTVQKLQQKVEELEAKLEATNNG